MAFVINVIKWLLWTVETSTLYKVLGRDYILSGIYYFVLVRNACQHSQQTRRTPNAAQCWSNAGTQSATLAQPQTSTGSTPRVCWAAYNPVNTKHYCSVSFVECFGKSKKLQVRDYLFK